MNENRIAEIFDLLDFHLTVDEIASLDALDTGKRGGPDQDSSNAKSFPFRIKD